MTAHWRPLLSNQLLKSKKFSRSMQLPKSKKFNKSIQRQRPIKKQSISQRSQRVTSQSPGFIPIESLATNPVALRITSCQISITFLRVKILGSTEMKNLTFLYYCKSYRKRKKLQIQILSIESTPKRKRRRSRWPSYPRRSPRRLSLRRYHPQRLTAMKRGSS